MWHWLIVGAVILILWRLFASRLASTSELQSAPGLRTTGSYSKEIVGESNYQTALRAITSGQEIHENGQDATAILVPEDRNPYDKNAIMVKIEGKLVGYLPRDEARLYRGRLKRAKKPLTAYSCPAKIFGGGRKMYGVWLDLPDRLTEG